MSRYVKILSDSILVGGRQGAILTLTILQTLLAARVLGPHDFGVYAFVYIFIMIAGIGNLGFMSVASRELPHYRAQMNEDMLAKLTNHVNVGELFISAVWVLVTVIVAVSQNDELTRICLIIVAFSIFPAKIVSLYQLAAYAEKNFELSSGIDFYRALIAVCLIFTLIWSLGIYIVLLAPAIGNLLAIVIYRRHYSLIFRTGEVTFSEFRYLSNNGWPIALLNVLSGSNGIQRWLERPLISAYLGNAALGIYAFAAWITLTFLALFGAVFQALQPHIYEVMSKDLNGDEVRRYLLGPMWAIIVGGSVVLGTAFVMLPSLILWLLPEYVEGVGALGLLLFAAFFWCISWVPSIVLNSVKLNAQGYAALLWSGAVAVSIATGYLGLQAGYGVISVAAGVALSYFIVTLFSFVRVWNYFFPQSGDFMKFLIPLLWPLINIAVALAIAYAIGIFLPMESDSRLSLPLNAAVQGLTFVCAALPTLLLFEKRVGIVSGHILPKLKRQFSHFER